MRIRRFPALVLAIVVAIALGSCGGSADDSDEGTIPGGADAEDVAVIQEWSTTLREGDVDAAAKLFAIPSVAQNGPEVAITSPEKARLFNASLPCGAKLIEAIPHAGYTIATFELTERPGAGSCEGGVGSQAQTAFQIEDGLIVEWRRVFSDEDGQQPAPEAPTSST